jgi:alkylation response protein AidB-like acyl-CoA dehydrogenase
MRFELSQDQRDFAATLDGLLTSADAPTTARAWAAGDHEPGLALWRKLAEAGVSGLLAEGYRLEHVIAMEAIGHHAAPGPWIESAAYLATCPETAEAVAEGIVATVAVPPHTPYALDADVADSAYVLGDDGPREASVGELVRSIDPTRRLFSVTPGEPAGLEVPEGAFDLAVLATSAQLLGCGERLLADTVEYAKQRRQFGREIGSYQAVKHALADVRIALDFARPLVLGAAVEGSCASEGAPAHSQTHDPFPRDVSAAKVAAGDAAYLASRVALQVHGAIGYTREHDLSLWIAKVRALVGAWGTPAFHRARVLESL